MTLAINYLKRGLAHKETQFARDALEAELQYVTNPTVPNKTEWLCKDSLYHSLLNFKAQKKSLFHQAVVL